MVRFTVRQFGKLSQVQVALRQAAAWQAAQRPFSDHLVAQGTFIPMVKASGITPNVNLWGIGNGVQQRKG